MVPKVADKGRSFKGAGLYYLHDKEASTAGRVAFTHTENLPTDNPELALRYMAYTAMRQGELKALSGATKPGRKLARPVYTYSLSWAPGETPTRAQMLEAARGSIKALGLDAHETLIVCHTDEPHPHIHVIVNRVHPETGLAATLACDCLVLSRWAEGYERQQGQIRCEARVRNNKLRRQLKAQGVNGFVKDRTSLDAAAFDQSRSLSLKAAFDPGQPGEEDFFLTRDEDIQALHDEKVLRIRYRCAQIRDWLRPHWDAMYRRQAREVEELRASQRRAFSRLVYWVRHRRQFPARGFLTGAFEAVLGRRDFAGFVAARHQAERKELARKAAEAIRETIRAENEAYRAELEELRQLRKPPIDSISDIHARQSHDPTRAIRDAREEEADEHEAGFVDGARTLTEEFRRYAGGPRKKPPRRGGRGKSHTNEPES